MKNPFSNSKIPGAEEKITNWKILWNAQEKKKKVVYWVQ